MTHSQHQNMAIGERPSPKASRLRLCLLSLMAVSVFAASGCSAYRGVQDYLQYNDAADDFVLGWRNYVWARNAWRARAPMFAGHPQFHALGEGFRAGYEDVAAGGDGCPPPLPPRKFWSWKYQTAEGQAKTAAWFEGYPYGAKAAEEEGAGLFREIQVAREIEVQYSPAFRDGYLPRRAPGTTPASGKPLPPPDDDFEELLPTPSPPPGAEPPRGPLPPPPPPQVPPALQSPEVSAAARHDVSRAALSPPRARIVAFATLNERRSVKLATVDQTAADQLQQEKPPQVHVWLKREGGNQ